MKPGNTACMAVTLGAALELKDQVAKPYSSTIKRNLSAIGSSAAKVIRQSEIRRREEDSSAKEESLRMVMYLSCWGPN